MTEHAPTMTADDIRARIDAMRAKYGDDALADDIRARIDAMHAKYGDDALADAARVVANDLAAVLGGWSHHVAPPSPHPPFHAQPWAPRRRRRKACRR